MADCKPNYASAISTLLFAFFHLQFLSLPIAGDLTVPYEPTEIISLDCGSSGNTHQLGDTAHTWEGDTASKFFPSNLLHNGQSIQAEAQFSPAGVPFTTARLSHAAFTYLFPLTPGQKFIRLYFYSAKFQSFDRSKAVFSVSAGPFTLLRDFNAAVNADASGEDTLFREFCVYVEGNDQKLNLTFSPSNQDSYAFVSGIQIVSMPVNLYHTPPEMNNDGGRGLNLVGQNNQFFPIENYTSLEMVYRMNICGELVSSVHDTGMFRTWSRESNLSDEYLDDACPTNFSIHLNHSRMPAYSAPDTVYQSARTMGPNGTRNKRYNLTWVYPVDPGFFYMIRLHFCEFQKQINDTNDRVFLIYIANTIAETSADVFGWAGGKGIPYYRDYAVNMPPNNGEMKVNLSVMLQANPEDWRTRFTNVILNGIEIFKLNDSSGNLAGQNPDPPPTLPLLPSTPQPKKSNGQMVAILIPAVVGGVTAILALGLFVFLSTQNIFRPDLEQLYFLVGSVFHI